MVATGKQDWRELCKAASQEQDSEKLLALVNQINDALSQLGRPIVEPELRRASGASGL